MNKKLDMKEELDTSTEYKTGEMTDGGKFICINCGGKIHMKKPGHIPPCYKCSKSRFHLEQEIEKIEIDNTGNYLRTLRMGKGLSIKDVTEATRISETNLNAIEDENFSALPANTFTRGLLNIYAEFLGANKETVVVKFMEERGDSSSQKRRPRHKQSGKILSPKRLAEPTQISSMTMAGILLLLIVVSFTGYCMYTSWNPFSFLMEENRDMQSVMKSAFSGEEITKSEGLIVEQNTEALVPNYTLTIRFLEDTGIELVKDNDERFVEEFESGDVHSSSAESSLTVTFSQPDSAEIFVNDSAVTFPEQQNGIYTLKIPHDIAEAEIQPDE